MSRFEGKVALVTGGSSGIGRATALQFASEGAKVVIAARGQKRGEQVVSQIKAAGGEAIFVSTDVSIASDVETMVKTTVETYGRLDCAFNNAGMLGNIALTADLAEDEFDKIIATNIKGVWLCMKYEILQMIKQDPQGGNIVNTSSASGTAGDPGASPYCLTKAAIMVQSQSAALEYALQGIRVNALVPGAFLTPMLERSMINVMGGNPAKLEEGKALFADFPPLKRIGDPKEAAEAALWLCSDAASYVTGSCLAVDGGISAHW